MKYRAIRDPNFYRYNQTIIKVKSRILTLVVSRPELIQKMSIDRTTATRDTETSSEEFIAVEDISLLREC